MIFVTVGSQKFQFNRLLQYLDDLVEKQVVSDKIFAQTGFCDYHTLHYTGKSFLDEEEFNQKLLESDLVITHGGTGTIMKAVKAGKKVIAVPRLCKFAEHVDDHQEQIVKQFMEEKIIMGVAHLEDMEEAIKMSSTFSVKPYVTNTHAIIESIEHYILELENRRTK